MRPHISYSEVYEFANNCQHRWYLNYYLKHRREIQSIHFDFGTAMHSALERHYTRKDPVSVEEAERIFKEELSRLYAEHSPKYDKAVDAKELERLTVAGINIIRSFGATPELQGAEVVHNEYPLFEPISRDDGMDIKFKGFIDLVIKSKDKRGKPILYVCDFKTCSWGWDGDTRQDRWKHYQVFLYKHFLCKRFNIDPKQVRTAFILLKKRPAKGVHPVEFFPVSAGPVSVQRALDVLNENITEMSARLTSGEFVKNRKSCVDKYGNTCPHYDGPLCPGKF